MSDLLKWRSSSQPVPKWDSRVECPLVGHSRVHAKCIKEMEGPWAENGEKPIYANLLTYRYSSSVLVLKTDHLEFDIYCWEITQNKKSPIFENHTKKWFLHPIFPFPLPLSLLASSSLFLFHFHSFTSLQLNRTYI